MITLCDKFCVYKEIPLLTTSHVIIDLRLGLMKMAFFESKER